jgi:hypothetical protein
LIRIDHTLLEQLGLGELPDRDGNALLRALYEELQVEFEQLIEHGDEDAAGAFLERHAPEHRQIVEQEFARLRESVGSAAPELLAAARRAQVAAARRLEPAVPRMSVPNRRALRTRAGRPAARSQRAGATEA